MPKACDDYNESLELKEREFAKEMEQQRINDSIAKIRLLKIEQRKKDSITEVRRQEAEQRRKDSIDAFNEQLARLTNVHNLNEQKEPELEKLELKNIVDAFNSYIKSNTRGWDLMSNFKDCKRTAGFEMETRYFPFGAKYEGVLLMNNEVAVRNSFGDAIKWDFILEGARVGADLLILKSAEPYHDIHDYLQNTMKSKLISTETLELAWLYLYSYKNTYILIHIYGGGSAGNEIEIYLGNEKEYMESVIVANIRSENF